jgi:proteasome component ECM29
MELLVHINKRVKTNERVQLPMEALLKQYQDPCGSSFVFNFTVIYIRMGFVRLPPDQRALLVPSMLASLEGKPQAHQDSLLALILPVLSVIPLPDDEERRSSVLGLHERPVAARLLCSYLLDYLLLSYGSHPTLVTPFPDEDESMATARHHPGMSQAGWRRVAGEAPIKAEVLEKNKAGVVKFAGSGLLPDKDVSILLVVGSSDSRHSVATEAETQVK